jgi:NADH-quinone oxidoreductase subunit E
MFHLEPVGAKAHIQVCGTTPCWLRGAGDLKKVCQERIHHDQHHLSSDGSFSWEEVECVGACVNAPLVQINADTYEDLTVESFNKLIDDIDAGRKIKPGPQIDRKYSAPFGGQTSLTGEIYRPGASPWTPPPAPPPAAEAPKPAPATDAPKPTPAPKA